MSHASRKIWILSDSLNDPILADKSFSDRVHKLILSYRQAEVRILLENDSQRVVNSSPILQVAQKLSSFVSIRKLSDKRVMAKEWLYLFDDHSAIERKRELGYRGQAFIENPLVLQRLSYQFDNLWQHSVPSTELRRLAI